MSRIILLDHLDLIKSVDGNTYLDLPTIPAVLRGSKYERVDNPIKHWMFGEDVQCGDERLWQGQVYYCVPNHRTSFDKRPDPESLFWEPQERPRQYGEVLGDH